MNVLTVSWLVFLAQIKYFSCDASNPFILKEEHLTAVEGSCVEIKCEPGRHVSGLDGAYWFWMKDATWNDSKTDFYGSVIYSSDESKSPVDPLFKNRVHYIDSSPPSLSRSFQSEKLCKILICDLNKADSGNYMFRFDGGNKRWQTEPGTNLTVEENPCPINFERPQVVKENEVVTLRCSTLNSCDSNLQIVSLKQRISTQLLSSSRSETESSKITTQKFNVSWKDDGMEFSCQTEKNEDKYLIRNISLTVDYAPKEVFARKSSGYVEEGNSVTLSCSAKGHPPVNFNWFKDDQKLMSRQEFIIRPVKPSDSGLYFCEAKNEIGTRKSRIVEIDVLYVPEVEVKVRPEHPGGSKNNIQEGNTITLECSVKRSNPQPDTFTLLKNGTKVGTKQTHVVNGIQLSDVGNYTCTAQNKAGLGTSEPYLLQVQYSPKDVKVTTWADHVKENESFSLDCSAQSEPSVASFTWMKTNNNKESVVGSERTYSVKSARPSDSGLYRCSAKNKIGIGESQQTEVKVMYAPKHTTIIKGEEQQWSDGRRSVTLICSSLCYPHATYVWYNKTDHVQVSTQNITVYSGRAGEYYCTAENEMGRRSSEPVRLFDGRSMTIMNIVKFFFMISCILLSLRLLFSLFRCLRKRVVQNRNMRLYWSFLDQQNEDRSEADVFETFRSTEDFLTNRPCCSDVQGSQPRPDAMCASTINPIYSSVDLPNKNQAPPEQKLESQQHGRSENDSLNYHSLHFGNKKRKPKEDALYSKCDPKPVKEREEASLGIYKYISDVHAAKSVSPPNKYDCDLVTREDEVEVSYSLVTIKPKPGHQCACRNSSTSVDEPQYSQIRI